jgi:hypothetical protein
MEEIVDCGTRRKFLWSHLEKRKSELTMPTRCKDCEEPQQSYCLEKSWINEGKDPKMLKVTNIMINTNPTADVKAQKQAQKAQEQLEQVKEEVEDTEAKLEEHIEEEDSE